ncbi:Flp family type IVb pilin [Devosia sp. XGJD_8]|uniref:Flp family type IVb pilin n=1 Tax=Devosia sp. XGJD_8 TaxID=3391187 RepID=UPI0039851FA9
MGPPTAAARLPHAPGRRTADRRALRSALIGLGGKHAEILHRRRDRRHGIEYGLLAGLIAVAVIVSFVTLGDSLFNLMATGPGAAGNVIAAQTAKID